MIAIIHYNAGNTRSVQNALNRLGYPSLITNNPDEIKQADKVIFPGVGEASTAMKFLKDRGLDEVIPSLKQPVLGICLGMQLLCEYSEEGDTECLGVFPVRVSKYQGIQKVPHMGWNDFEKVEGSLFDGVDKSDNVNYVHSYFAEVGAGTKDICNYIQPFSAALEKDNFYATQFHPEKSAGIGEIILKNFLSL